MYSRVNGVGLYGLNAFLVDVEVELANGMPSFDIVGLGDTIIRESKVRLQAALRSSNIDLPAGKVTINLAPADTKKSGSGTDLPMAVALTKALGNFFCDDDVFSRAAFIGEVSLSGEVRPVNGVLPMVLQAREEHIKDVYVPLDNAYEASAAEGVSVYPVKDLRELIDHLNNKKPIQSVPSYTTPETDWISTLDLSDVCGQQLAKWGMEIAAAGGHNILLIGAPGSGKSMMAKRLPSILPSMTFEESLETTKVHSIAGLLNKEKPLVTIRPFRAPHHTISSAGLAGGGSIPKPGEISLAHNGVLFLDEMAEFQRHTLEILRQPMEEHLVTISRAFGTVSYPCDFILIGAMNPCPCGNFGNPYKKCICSPKQVSNYLSKISGPLLDRFDLHIEISPVDFKSLSSKQATGDSSEAIRSRVQMAREIQKTRFLGTNTLSNARIPTSRLHEWCPLTDEAQALFEMLFQKLSLSARAYDRILKVARTISDLEGADYISKSAINKAVQYRSLDRKYWNR